MTINEFRRIAMSMPLAVEGEHMDHPDFRVKGKIFATLPPDPDGTREPVGVVKLTPAQQRQFMQSDPGVFAPAQGAWGVRGYTRVRLGEVDRRTLRRAIATAWCNTAPKRVVAELGHKAAG